MRSSTLEPQDNRLTVKAGKSRFNLQTLPAADFPRIGQGAGRRSQTLALPQKALRGLLGLVQYAMAQQDIRYYLNGVLLVVDKDTLQARGDRRPPPARSRACRSSSDYAAAEVILPRKTVLELGQAARPTPTTR